MTNNIVSEVALSYKNRVPYNQRQKVITSHSAYEVLTNIFPADTIDFRETFIVDVRGALQVKQNYPESILFFIEAPSEQDLYDRLVKRGTENEEKIQIRMARNKLELAQKHKYDYCIMNDNVDRAVKEIISILDQRR